MREHFYQTVGQGITGLIFLVLVIGCAGCGSSRLGGDREEFFTSGSREADQRASQRMARAEQIEELGEEADGRAGVETGAVRAEEKRSLFDRLGGEVGISNIVEDFLPRALQDPRVNWSREGIEKGGLFSRGPVVEWEATTRSVAVLKMHVVQFLCLSTGGPAEYGGKDMTATHADMRITNTEFDATVGDLKASLDKLQVPDREQMELLAIIESTRNQVVTER